jgi:tetratricopeptide (TPR) repeat protein
VVVGSPPAQDRQTAAPETPAAAEQESPPAAAPEAAAPGAEAATSREARAEASARAAAPVAAEQGRDEHGLGWLLQLNGLGAPSTEPVSPAPAAPDAAEDKPVEAVRPPMPRVDWFNPTTDPRLDRPGQRGSTDGPARQPAAERAHPERPLVDPEHVLAAYRWRFDPETLRERADDPDQLLAVRDRLTDKVEYVERDAVRARLLSLRAVVSRILGDLDEALLDGRDALGHAEATGELRRTAIAAARLAHVLQWRGEYAEADKLYAQANSDELPDRLRAEMAELAGRSAYEQGRFLEAMNHFETALDLRKGQDPEMSARVETALDAIERRARAEGWGPYPRSRDEILQVRQPPEPTYDERGGLWGFAGVVPPTYLDVQPFHEGVAWVRRPGVATWELIDERGDPLIDADAGYLGTTEFAEGLAWVTRDGAGGWFAIDRRNRVIIPGGFEDVRPFRRSVAPVRRGGWGAIDRHGRMVVQPKYRTFATVLSGGRRVEGFTDEGLAVIDAGDRLGVVDRTGRLVVPPVHAGLIIHPVAFLVEDRQGRWGALDRQGEPLIDVVHATPADVTDEIDRLLADTRPVL